MKTFFKIFVCLGVLLNLAACQDPGLSNGGGCLMVMIGDDVSRTLLPDIDMKPASYNLAGTGPGGATFNQDLTEGMGAITGLTPGVWNVTATAKNKDGTAIGSGIGSATVYTNAPSSIVLSVTPLTGNGSLSLLLAWDASTYTNPMVTASLVSQTGTSHELSFVVDAVTGTASCTATGIPAGYHTMMLTFLDNGTAVTGAVEAVRIVQGQTTNGSFALGGSLTIVIDPNMGDPLQVAITGTIPIISTLDRQVLSAACSNSSGDVVYSWYLNGISQGCGPTMTLANLNAGNYRVDALAFSADGTRAGSALTTFEVAQNHTITFNANGGTGTMDLCNLGQGFSLKLPANAFTRAGYSFSSWNTVAGGTGTTYTNLANFTMSNADTILYARWAANSYTLSYNANGGSGTMAAQTIKCDATAALTANTFTRTGYTFSGWNKAAGGTSTAYANLASYKMGAANASLYAQWTGNPYTVSFNTNGGSGTMAAQTIACGSGAALTANTFTRTGYTFVGWNTVATGTGTAYANLAAYTMGSASVTLYAQWKATYTISFNANGGTGTMAAQTIIGGTAAALSANTLTRTNYIFKGWNTVATGTGTAYADKASYAMGTANTTLYAQWAASQTITFNPNGGTAGSMQQQTIGTGLSAALSANAFTRGGYAFKAWNTALDGTGTSYADKAIYTMGSGSIVLHAQWSVAYAVNFDANGGNGSMTAQAIGTGLKAALKANSFAKTGYSFKGWNTAANGSGTAYANNAIYTMAAANTTLYAQWTINTYTVSFNANGGTGTKANLSGTFGSIISLGANSFTRDSYEFLGYSTNKNSTAAENPYTNWSYINYTIPGNNVCLYAIWQAAPKVVIFADNIDNYYNYDDFIEGQAITLPGNDFSSYEYQFTTSQSVRLTRFVRTGYTFKCWMSDFRYYYPGDKITLSSKYRLFVIYPVWTANLNTLSFDSHGGNGNMPSIQVHSDESIYLPANTFTRPGYEFNGWDSDYTLIPRYSNGAAYKMESDNITLFAHWTRLHNLSFDANGGQGSMTSVKIYNGRPYVLPANSYYRRGFVFAGWNTRADGMGGTYEGRLANYGNSATIYIDDDDTVLYAQWTATPTVN